MYLFMCSIVFIHVLSCIREGVCEGVNVCLHKS